VIQKSTSLKYEPSSEPLAAPNPSTLPSTPYTLHPGPGSVQRRQRAHDRVPFQTTRVSQGKQNKPLLKGCAGRHVPIAVQTLLKGFYYVCLGRLVWKALSSTVPNHPSQTMKRGPWKQGGYNEGKGLMIAYRSKGSLKYRGSDSGCRVQGAGFRVQGFRP